MYFKVAEVDGRNVICLMRIITARNALLESIFLFYL